MICEICGREMKAGVMCDPTPVVINDMDYALVVFGEEQRFPKPFESENCPDCGTPKGYWHHAGCDIEECPKCHRQLIGCPCGQENVKDYEG